VYGQHKSVDLDVTLCSLAGGYKIFKKYAACIGRVQVGRTKMWSLYTATRQ
jgi:hypothetical protein